MWFVVEGIVAVWWLLVSCCVPAGSDSSSWVGGGHCGGAPLQAPSEWLSHIGECHMYSHHDPYVWLHSPPFAPPSSSVFIFYANWKGFQIRQCLGDCYTLLLLWVSSGKSSLTIHLHHPFDHPYPPSPPPGPGKCPLEITIEKHDARDHGGLLHSGNHLSCSHPPSMWNTARWYQARQLYAQEHNVGAIGGVSTSTKQRDMV